MNVSYEIKAAYTTVNVGDMVFKVKGFNGKQKQFLDDVIANPESEIFFLPILKPIGNGKAEIVDCHAVNITWPKSKEQ